jgi:class 3 adenylate cyclase
MTAQTQKLAVLFADISGSTALYEKLGDQKARLLIARCIFILKSALATHNGTMIKTIGDEILCTFPSAEQAMNAACEMQMAIKTDNRSTDNAMYVRIGFHYGDVICEDGDVYGDTVNVASRVAAITRASQILTTGAAVDALPLSVQDKVRKILRADIKGKQQQIDIHQVMWELEDMGSTRIGMSAYRKPPAEGIELILTYRNDPYTVSEKNKKLQLGRDDTCHIIVKNDFVSRQHAHIEFKAGNFILYDHSSNGSFIRSSDRAITCINHEDAILKDRGTISLGQPYTDSLLDLVEYSIKPAP